MSVTRMRGKGQLTLPSEIRRLARLEEGDPIVVEMTDEGILLRPQKIIDATQAWFWSAGWQEGELRAEQDIADERFERFESDDDFLSALDARIKPPDADS